MIPENVKKLVAKAIFRDLEALSCVESGGHFFRSIGTQLKETPGGDVLKCELCGEMGTWATIQPHERRWYYGAQPDDPTLVLP